MVILDTLTVADMEQYRAVLAQIGDDDRACGFICSVEDMRSWNPLEVCQLRYTTKDLYGRLDDFLPTWTREDEVNYVKMSLNNLYHALCHSYIHGDRARLAAHLLDHYKSAFFILQNAHFLASGCTEFPLTKAELTERLTGDDRAVMEVLRTLTQGGEVEFDRQFALLFRWCQGKMATVR